MTQASPSSPMSTRGLAISVREALKEAIAAFATSAPAEVTLAVPATPEAVFWAIERGQQSHVAIPIPVPSPGSAGEG